MTLTSRLNVAFFGECMVEISGSPLEKRFGGDTLNTALYLSRLTQSTPIKVSYATGLGVDKLSDQMLDQWTEEGIAIDLVERKTSKLPGLYMVETDSTGERHFMYWRDNSAAKHYFLNLEVTKLEQALESKSIDVLYVSGISLAILSDEDKARLLSAVRGFSESGGQVVFDNNFRPQLWSAEQAKHWYEQLLPWVNIALITEDDDQLVWGVSESVQSRCARFGVKEVVIKRGCEPCKVIINAESNEAKDAQEWYIAAERVAKVVDTCAAGDSFAAGYLAARLMGKSAEESATLGHRLASIVIQFPGAIIPINAMLPLCE